MLRSHLSSITVAFYSFVVVSLVGIPGTHAEVGVYLLPDPFKPLDNLDIIPEHLLADLVQTNTLADVDDCPKQMLIGAFELIA